MKQVTQIVPFFLNPDNMQYLLKGKSIENFDEMHKGLFENIKKVNNFRNDHGIYPIYATREINRNSEYADMYDRIIAKVLRYIQREDGHNSLEIEILDSLEFCKLTNPCIKLHGYFTELDNGNLHMEEITRLTISNMNGC